MKEVRNQNAKNTLYPTAACVYGWKRTFPLKIKRALRKNTNKQKGNCKTLFIDTRNH